jgi:hypothetical protein
MTPDNLDSLSLEELDEVFVTEVSGGHETMVGYWYHITPRQDQPDSKGSYDVPPFSTSADAVLLWLEKWSVEIRRHGPGIKARMFGWEVRIYDDECGRERHGRAPTFPHAAAKALIRAERAKKGNV